MIIKIFMITALIVLSHLILHMLHYQTFPYYIGTMVGACITGIMMIGNEDIMRM